MAEIILLKLFGNSLFNESKSEVPTSKIQTTLVTDGKGAKIVIKDHFLHFYVHVTNAKFKYEIVSSKELSEIFSNLKKLSVLNSG